MSVRVQEGVLHEGDSFAARCQTRRCHLSQSFYRCLSIFDQDISKYFKMDYYIEHQQTIADGLEIYGNVLFYVVVSVYKILGHAYRNLVLFLILALIVFIFYLLYKSYVSPVLQIRELSHVGYNHVPQGPDRSLHLLRAQSTRQLGDKMPPPYPNGWFSLVESMDLKVGSVVSVDALGLNFCVYRGEDGVARVIEAYCPHLGANFGIGGRVSGDCIECPFHQWRFGADGKCVSIPDLDSVPKGISIKTYPTMEIDGSVWTWYHVDGAPPQWNVEEMEELKTWGYRGRNEFLVNAHIQEVPENGADAAHLNSVHNILLGATGYKYPILSKILGRHIWIPEWSRTDQDHIAIAKIQQKYIMMKINVFPFNITVHQIGPGQVRLRIDSSFGPSIICQSVTPVGPLLQKVVHRVYTPTYNAVMGPILVFYETYQFQRDVAIWNSKKYISSPSYVKTDKQIRMYRAWFGQFYTESSISMKDAIQNPLDW